MLQAVAGLELCGVLSLRDVKTAEGAGGGHIARPLDSFVKLRVLAVHLVA